MTVTVTWVTATTTTYREHDKTNMRSTGGIQTFLAQAINETVDVASVDFQVF